MGASRIFIEIHLVGYCFLFCNERVFPIETSQFDHNNDLYMGLPGGKNLETALAENGSGTKGSEYTSFCTRNTTGV